MNESILNAAEKETLAKAQHRVGATISADSTPWELAAVLVAVRGLLAAQGHACALADTAVQLANGRFMLIDDFPPLCLN